MTGEAIVSTPGKTILFGEHAAVYGRPALVASLDHRMTVEARVDPALPAGAVRLSVPAAGIDRTVVDASAVAGAVRPGDLAVLAVAEAAGGRVRPGLSVHVESAIPSGAGFGSSAALAVAVIAGCRSAWGDEIVLETLTRDAILVERAQHGRSSGVDVVSVLRGGVLCCRRERDEQVTYDGVELVPGALESVRLYHTGPPRETTAEMVAAVARLRAAEPLRVEDAFDSMTAATSAARAALAMGDPGVMRVAVRIAESALEEIGVVPETVRGIIRRIESDGGAAKVSGAGGASGPGAGLVLVVHPDPDAADRLALAHGWTPHRVALGVPGLRLEVAA